MKPKIVLCGKTASGKTELSRCLVQLGLKKMIGCTTRPMRPVEVDGVDYKFFTKRKFKKEISKNSFIEHTTYNGWYYGMMATDFNGSDVLICTPTGLQTLLKTINREEFFVAYLDAPDDLILERLIQRQDNPNEIERRMKSDAADFEGFTEYDICFDVTNMDTIKTLDSHAKILKKIIERKHR